MDVGINSFDLSIMLCLIRHTVRINSYIKFNILLAGNTCKGDSIVYVDLYNSDNGSSHLRAIHRAVNILVLLVCW